MWNGTIETIVLSLTWFVYHTFHDWDDYQYFWDANSMKIRSPDLKTVVIEEMIYLTCVFGFQNRPTLVSESARSAESFFIIKNCKNDHVFNVSESHAAQSIIGRFKLKSRKPQKMKLKKTNYLFLIKDYQ